MAKVVYKSYNRNEGSLFPVYLSDMVPAEHPARVVDAVVDNLDISELERGYKGGGTSSYDPRALLKVIIYSYLTNVYSGRQMAKLWNENIEGFMKDIDSDFLSALGISHKVTALNTVTYGGGSIILNDKFFLPSRSEVYGGLENNTNEGSPYPYFSNYSDRSSAGTGNDMNRIKLRNDSVQAWWLRSPGYASSGNNCVVGSNGNLTYSSVSDVYGISPACNIELDEDYSYNGQVLHVRDQISVTKGNQMLVFDVIGIDHDEVDFDKTTTEIYLSEPLIMVGDEVEYVDYQEQKQHFADGTSIDITLPALQTIAGTNSLSVETEVQPSEVEIKGRIKILENNTYNA